MTLEVWLWVFLCLRLTIFSTQQTLSTFLRACHLGLCQRVTWDLNCQRACWRPKHRPISYLCWRNHVHSYYEVDSKKWNYFLKEHTLYSTSPLTGSTSIWWIPDLSPVSIHTFIIWHMGRSTGRTPIHNPIHRAGTSLFPWLPIPPLRSPGILLVTSNDENT